MMEDHAAFTALVSTDAALGADLEALRRDGFLIIPNMLSRFEVEALDRQVRPWLLRTPRCEGAFHGHLTTRVNALLSKSGMVQKIALNPRMLAIAEALLTPACDCITLNLTQAIAIHPGERAQAPHRDKEMWPINPGGRFLSLNVMWAVSDFTEANGATMLWPQSHADKLGRTPNSASALPAEMKAGSALIYLGALTHGAGANRSSHDRVGVVIGYCAGWLRTYENQYLAYPRPIARTFPEELQRLIGYRPHRPNLGHWEGQDPIEYLREARICGGHRDALPPNIVAELATFYGDSDRG
jgi:hypothetical protein